MRVDDVADVRAGDKGDTLILAVLPRDAAGWDLLQERLTVARVAEHFGAAVRGQVLRHELPLLPGLVFRVPGVLAGGVTGAATLDGHGKTLSYHLLTLELGG
ncbi:AtuA-related protein [Nocardioides sp. AX2bis]|uniref:AtuA-related protein n=1 Tax=Nocardioides sp. AX2bis TaxID=2653157 RepID=UPI0012F0916E|nr:hypothetical protein [Nocardioides sp. AX2bis]VXB43383.1 Beta-lactamase [Nocardioides sp. AX2bis]